MEWFQRSEKVPNHDLITVFSSEITGRNPPGLKLELWASLPTQIHTRLPWAEVPREVALGTLHLFQFSHISLTFPTLFHVFPCPIRPPTCPPGNKFCKMSLNAPLTCIPSFSANNPSLLMTFCALSLRCKLLVGRGSSVFPMPWAAQRTDEPDVAGMQILKGWLDGWIRFLLCFEVTWNPRIPFWISMTPCF